MIASFFRHLEAQRVEWLLISGQATILYGAATFSEDIDLWVNPTERNFERFRTARTLPLTAENALQRHGFWRSVSDSLRQLQSQYP